MPLRRFFRFSLFLGIVCVVAQLCSFARPQQQAPAASGARILLLPRQIVSGERATLAVLNVDGRLTPGVTVNFSNGDKLVTDATGRALFVAPLTSGVLFASIAGRTGRVSTTVIPPSEAASSSVEIASVPRVASLTDRFELLGRSFCGDADSNQVSVAGHPALVLASSPVSLVILPPMDLGPGPAAVNISCANHQAPSFAVAFAALDLETNSSPLKPGERRALTVRVRGTMAKIALEARNLAPEIAELSGGNPIRLSSSGGAENFARFDLIGRKNGSFLISIRLVPSFARPQ
jgi:hypothetical protein